MPRWKALPEELDPQIREFTGQLRRLVDRSGLSIAALADRTGYSKTSWERYLNGRLLAPRGAIVALAEATGTNQAHLNTMWELAERAWSRAEMRHDMTMEAIRITQARAALDEAGGPRGHGRSRPSGAVGTAGGALPGQGRPPSVPAQRGSLPRVPQQPQAGPDSAPGHGLPPAVAFVAGIGGPQPPARPAGGSRRTAVIAVVVVGVLLVVTGVVLLIGSGGGSKGAEGPTTPSPPSPTPRSSAPPLPAGVECSGSTCAGQDPEEMGCGGKHVRTLSTTTVGKSVIEVRYSEPCAAAWARITAAVPGDTVEITAGGAGQNSTVDATTAAYTPMVAVKRIADVEACATLASGTKGCTVEAAG
ncbi:DUF2690 domain-containing protein [Streptomyces sp. BE230]|uniref:DUF2690 domain-containing protein n=1 Tax=Streptomyces sp. BE230 TaxID=3002526 RepID=UPI002ED18FE3|nr:DUF2690 domain-containing protein [Streptomyces sp. BE230]